MRFAFPRTTRRVTVDVLLNTHTPAAAQAFYDPRVHLLDHVATLHEWPVPRDGTDHSVLDQVYASLTDRAAPMKIVMRSMGYRLAGYRPPGPGDVLTIEDRCYLCLMPFGWRRLHHLGQVRHRTMLARH